MNNLQDRIKRINANAEYTLKILQAQQTIVSSWGATKFKACEYREMPSLKFRVRGFLHKGYVYVCFNGGADLFEVYLTNMKGKEVNSITGVYFDMLVDTIDSMVETKNDKSEEYHNNVNDFIKDCFK